MHGLAGMFGQYFYMEIPTELTAREKDVLKLVCDGLTDKQIADKLNLSAYTVRTHRKSILGKLKLNKTVLLVRYALKHKIIE